MEKYKIIASKEPKTENYMSWDSKKESNGVSYRFYKVDGKIAMIEYPNFCKLGNKFDHDYRMILALGNNQYLVDTISYFDLPKDRTNKRDALKRFPFLETFMDVGRYVKQIEDIFN